VGRVKPHTRRQHWILSDALDWVYDLQTTPSLFLMPRGVQGPTYRVIKNYTFIFKISVLIKL